MSSDFLPSDYQQPKSGSANYMKFEDGENRFRILSKPIVGWEDWDDKKPIRFRMNEKPAKPINPDKKIKHFWAFLVWDYKDKAIKILEITQASIQSAITSLTKDDDWGSPFEYDIKVNKSGQSLDTEYVVNPVPHKPITEEIKSAQAAKPVRLEALFEGEDPFDVPAKEAGESDDLPFS